MFLLKGLINVHLSKYSGKKVILTDVDGDKFEGIADLYTSAFDNPSGVASVVIKQSNNRGVLIEFEEHEIANIELVPATTQNLALAV